MSATRRQEERRSALLPKVLALFLAALFTASVATLLLETRLARQQLEVQAAELFGEVGDVLDARIAADAVRTSQVLSTVSQELFSSARGPVTDPDELARRTLSVVRTTSPELELVAVIDVRTGVVRTLGLPNRYAIAPPSSQDAAEVARRLASSQRVVPLDGDGYALVNALAVDRSTGAARLLVAGAPLNRVAARRYQEQTGVDEVELVVAGEVVATSGPVRETIATPAGQWQQPRTTQRLDDGRLVRYVTLGADRAWDTPAAIGLISADPLVGLGGALTRTRILMVALLLLLGGALSLALARIVTGPLSTLTATAMAIAAGDLDRSFDVRRTDEIGHLAEALERMRRGLRAQLLVIRRQAAALQDAARRMVGAQDAERQRIAHDLHDGIQQQLVILRMQVGAARRELEADPHRVSEVTHQLAESIDHLLDQLRSTGQQLFPAILRDRGLGPALFSLSARLELPVDVVFDPDPLPRVDAEVEINAYFLVSEAVVNAIKHAGATRLHVEVRTDRTHLYVHVRDDGVGFDPHGEGHRGGLTHMRDRVQALGGVLDLTAAPGEGTRVDAALPLSAGPGSVVGALEVEQHRGDAPVQIDLRPQAELAEDRVGVLLHGALGDGQLPGDGSVAPARGHQGHDLHLPGGQTGQA